LRNCVGAHYRIRARVQAGFPATGRSWSACRRSWARRTRRRPAN
jgi:hypothetical protein